MPTVLAIAPARGVPTPRFYNVYLFFLEPTNAQAPAVSVTLSGFSM